MNFQDLLRLTSIPYLIATLFCSVLVYTCTITIYRLYFHPLARFPGPKIAAATQWYETYYDIFKKPGGQYWKEVEKMHEQYGPIVRVNPHEIHIRDPEYYETVYSGKRDKPYAAAALAGTDLTSFGTTDYALHKKRRAMHTPMLGKQAVFQAVPALQKQVLRLKKVFAAAAESGSPVELGVTFLAFTSDVVGDYFFRKSLGFQDDAAKAQRMYDALHRIVSNSAIAKQFPWLIKWGLNVPRFVFTALGSDMVCLVDLYSEMKERAEEFMNSVQKGAPDSVAEKKKGRPSSIFQSMYESDATSEEKSITRLQHVGVEFVTAGGETSSRVLKRAVYELVMNVHVLDSLRKEMHEAVAKTSKPLEEFTLTELERLSFLTGVVKESLRISGLVTGRMPVIPYTPLQYKDWVIPEKTAVSMSPIDTLRDGNIFPDPESFQPERWLTRSENGTLKPHLKLEKYLVVFGKGNRMCQGINLAYAELYLAIAMLAVSFDFELVDVVKERDIVIIKDCFLGEVDSSSPGVYVRVQKVHQ